MTKNKTEIINKKHNQPPNFYYLNFEEYLKPKSVIKSTKNQLLFKESLGKPQLRLKLLEHPVLIAGRKSVWQQHREKLTKKLKFKSSKSINLNNENKVVQVISIWRNKTYRKSSRFPLGCIGLPRFLAFLRARNDDGLCKRKSGFEIYCEMASIHGFTNFVGATTWQGTFWFLVVLLAVIMSGFILLLSHFMNTNTPTILLAETTQYPTWSIPFPAVTICNLNRISKQKALTLAEKFYKPANVSSNTLAASFHLALSLSLNIQASQKQYQLLNHLLHLNNYTINQLLDEITPSCELELLRCKWQGRFERCAHLFQTVRSSNGLCCAFNYKAFKKNDNKRTDFSLNKDVEYIASCGFKTGLTVLLDPHVKDYGALQTTTPGFEVLIHDAYDFTDFSTARRIITTTTYNKIDVLPQQTYDTEYIGSKGINIRRCYLPYERKLFHFASYSHINCLAECRSLLLYDKCHCTLPNWPKMANWSICGLEDRHCAMKHKFSALLVTELPYEKSDRDQRKRFNQRFICDCYPLCDFNMYNIAMDSGKLMRKYSLTDKRFFKSIMITDHILLHIYFSELHAERLRLDVYENWWSYIATFGGITGLYMGYSFVSGFELIFFVFVRPACNWLTKQQIRYRIKQRQKKAQLQIEHQKKLEEKSRQQERIE